MSLDESDEQIALLIEIRQEVRGMRDDVRAIRFDPIGPFFDSTKARFEAADRSLDRIEVALADCAQQTRLAVHYTKILAAQHGIQIDPV